MPMKREAEAELSISRAVFTTYNQFVSRATSRQELTSAFAKALSKISKINSL